MKEKIFNFFILLDKGFIRKIKVKEHEIDGTDEEKYKFLQDRVDEDLKVAREFDVPKRIIATDGVLFKKGTLTLEGYNTLTHRDSTDTLFEEIYKELGASLTPLKCCTMVVDGKIIIGRKVKIDWGVKKENDVNTEILKKYIFKGLDTKSGTIIECPLSKSQIIQLLGETKEQKGVINATDNIVLPDVIPGVIVFGCKNKDTLNKIISKYKKNEKEV